MTKEPSMSSSRERKACKNTNACWTVMLRVFRRTHACHVQCCFRISMHVAYQQHHHHLPDVAVQGSRALSTHHPLQSSIARLITYALGCCWPNCSPINALNAVSSVGQANCYTHLAAGLREVLLRPNSIGMIPKPGCKLTLPAC